MKEPSREKALFTLHVMIEMPFLLQKNLQNIMHGHIKMYVMRWAFVGQMFFSIWHQAV